MMASLTLTAMPLSVCDPGCAPRTKPSGRSRAARAMDEANFIKRRAECRKPLPAGQGPGEAAALHGRNLTLPSLVASGVPPDVEGGILPPGRKTRRFLRVMGP